MNTFAEILDAADHLSIDEQDSLAEILKKRVIVKRRAELLEEVKEAEKEFAEADLKPESVEDIMKDIQGE